LRDEMRFEEFYVAVFNRLVGQLFLVTGSLPEAEDVVQEALTRAAGRWTRLRSYEVPEIWVRRVAMNLATDGFRQARRRMLLAARLAPEPHPPPPWMAWWSPRHSGSCQSPSARQSFSTTCLISRSTRSLPSSGCLSGR
jgi:DNA-directed RNA polymerase specialized sigma24 family protein